jgi:hypothetical protein
VAVCGDFAAAKGKKMPANGLAEYMANKLKQFAE